MKILDCTFRDGGYQTGWHFDEGLVREYLQIIPADVVEIGFGGQKYGPFSRVTDELISRLNASVPLAVMLNVGDEYEGCGPDMIRIATHLETLGDAVAMADRYLEKGFLVGLNLMRAERLTSVPRLDVDVIWFADSYGTMKPEDVRRVAALIAGPKGFHAHENTGAALRNARAAMFAGVEWIDTTVSGIGRGAGNLPIQALTDLDWDLPIRKTWGWDMRFHLGARHGIHPTTVQNIDGHNPCQI